MCSSQIVCWSSSVTQSPNTTILQPAMLKYDRYDHGFSLTASMVEIFIWVKTCRSLLNYMVYNINYMLIIWFTCTDNQIIYIRPYIIVSLYADCVIDTFILMSTLYISRRLLTRDNNYLWVGVNRSPSV